MDQLEVIQQQIETERARLNQMEEQYGRLHPDVIRQSGRLDDLINEYHKAAFLCRSRDSGN
ncbi:aspartyl-phosphate phosphatase Spo0E family protein [Paenibacillus sp. MMS20-IR301]|uniref:aspartyl-phosphate phosphatase Spo0E family protein n=1 Tax=Paenibacillus sp. MMS20-IR301 TaxID=2895946 RepID=UPI0028ED061C|nr:aspartyl-phosphate phosphatase Spo0E family protein [Paenibacillus sp. MMS20-IR301]WNS41119.1 aspartyl-phosphate phosphatase Spo0E family protein [Paenibacillus sp. MMS20-IR301]